MAKKTTIKKIYKVIEDNLDIYKGFQDSVGGMLSETPTLKGAVPIIHTLKSRIKDPEHTKDKIKRKIAGGADITPDNVLSEITDIAGIRVLHLHTKQFEKIHEYILSVVDRGMWSLHEPPKAYTWDPESKKYFERLGLKTELKPSFYTSIHYVIKPKDDSPITCEIQVRTLFEEIWGEIDHTLNYPIPTSNEASKEQLRVLARLVGTGTRLANSIFYIHNECLCKPKAVKKKVAKKKVVKKK